jgi:hypothetical protein
VAQKEENTMIRSSSLGIDTSQFFGNREALAKELIDQLDAAIPLPSGWSWVYWFQPLDHSGSNWQQVFYAGISKWDYTPIMVIWASEEFSGYDPQNLVLPVIDWGSFIDRARNVYPLSIMESFVSNGIRTMEPTYRSLAEQQADYEASQAAAAAAEAKAIQDGLDALAIQQERDRAAQQAVLDAIALRKAQADEQARLDALNLETVKDDVNQTPPPDTGGGDGGGNSGGNPPPPTDMTLKLSLTASTLRVTPGEKVTFTVTKISGPLIASDFRWVFGDGTVISGSDSVEHEFTQQGEYNVQASAMNADDETFSTNVITIVVASSTPDVSAGFGTTGMILLAGAALAMFAGVRKGSGKNRIRKRGKWA